MVGKTLQSPAPPLCRNEAQSHEMCHEVPGEGITVGKRGMSSFRLDDLTAAIQEGAILRHHLAETHSLCSPGSQYPSSTSGVAVPLTIHDGSNREFAYSHTSTSPKSINLTFEIPPRVRTGPHLADKSMGLLLSPPQSRGISCHICLLTVSDNSQEHLCVESTYIL